MRAVVTAAIHFGSFLAIGLIAKALTNRWMVRRKLNLSEIHAQLEPRRGKRRVFCWGSGAMKVGIEAVPVARRRLWLGRGSKSVVREDVEVLVSPPAPVNPSF